MPYNENNTIQWKALSLLISAGILICFQYFIFVFFGLKIYFNMKLRLKSFSACQEKFQSQLFKALVAQTIGPTIFLILPSAPFFVTTLLSPYTNMEINWQTGWLCSFFELYPISDNIAFMLIVSEYRNYIKSEEKHNVYFNTKKYSNIQVNWSAKLEERSAARFQFEQLNSLQTLQIHNVLE